MSAPLPVLLKVCVTCDRSRRLVPGETAHGAQLADHIETELKNQDGAQHVILRRVPCLSGCKHPGNIAVRAVGRVNIRLHNLGLKSAATVVEMALKSSADGKGTSNVKHMPLELSDNVASIIPPP